MTKQFFSILLGILCISNMAVASKLDSLDVSVSLFQRVDLGDSFLQFQTADMKGKQRLKAIGGEFVVSTRLFGIGVFYDQIRNTFYRESISELSLAVPEVITGSVAGLFMEFYPVNRGRFKLSLRVGPIYGKADYLSCIDGYAYYEGSQLVFWQNYTIHKKQSWGITFGVNVAYRVFDQVYLSLAWRFDDYKNNDPDWEYNNQSNVPGAIMVSLGLGYRFMH